MIFFLLSVLVIFTGCDLTPSEGGQVVLPIICDTNIITTNPSSLVLKEGEADASVQIINMNNKIGSYYVTLGETQIPVLSDNTFFVSYDDVLGIENPEIHVSYREAIKMIEMFSSAPAGGTISPLGKLTFPEGTKVPYVAKANSDSKLIAWTVDGVTTKAVSNTCILEANANRTISPVFEKKVVYKLTATAVNGTVSSGYQFYEGDSASVTATGNNEYEISRLIVNGKDTVPNVKYTAYTNSNVDFVFEKGLGWYFSRFILVSDSLSIDNDCIYYPGREIINFSNDGTYIIFFDGVLNYGSWSRDKVAKTLTLGSGVCKVEVLNDYKIVISYINAYKQKVTKVYHWKLK